MRKRRPALAFAAILLFAALFLEFALAPQHSPYCADSGTMEQGGGSAAGQPARTLDKVADTVRPFICRYGENAAFAVQWADRHQGFFSALFAAVLVFVALGMLGRMRDLFEAQENQRASSEWMAAEQLEIARQSVEAAQAGAEATRNAVELAYRNSVNDLRPYLDVREIRINAGPDVGNGNPYRLAGAIVIENVGKTPAENVGFVGRVAWDNGRTGEDSIVSTISTASIGAGRPRRIDMGLVFAMPVAGKVKPGGGRVEKQTRIIDPGTKLIGLRIEGKVTYTDIFIDQDTRREIDVVFYGEFIVGQSGLLRAQDAPYDVAATSE